MLDRLIYLRFDEHLNRNDFALLTSKMLIFFTFLPMYKQDLKERNLTSLLAKQCLCYFKKLELLVFTFLFLQMVVLGDDGFTVY